MTGRRAESPDRVFSLKIEGPASEVAVSAACSRLFECMQILRVQVCAAHSMMSIPAFAVQNQKFLLFWLSTLRGHRLHLTVVVDIIQVG